MKARSFRSWLQDPDVRAGLLVAAAALLFLVPPIGSHTLWGRHEGRFSSGALEMVRTGDWLIPRNDGEALVFYPPLMTWLCALSGVVLGALSEFTMRLPAALASVGCVLLTWDLGRRLFDRATAFLSAIVVLTFIVWQRYTCACQPDSVMTFLFLGALAAFHRAQAEPVPRWRWTVILGLCFGGTLLAKGPLGVVLTLAVSFAFLALERRLRVIWAMRPFSIAAIALAVAVPWFWLAWRAEGTAYVEAMWHENFDMAAGGRMLMHKEPVFFYGPRLLYTTAPWCFFFLAALIPSGLRPAAERSSWRFLASWLGAVLLILTASQAKRPYYLIPVYPAVAIVTATWWTRGREAAAGWWATVRERGPWFAMTACGVAAVIVIPLLPRPKLEESGMPGLLLPLAAGALAIVVALAVVHFRLGTRASFAAMGGLMYFGTAVVMNFMEKKGDLEGATAVAWIRECRASVAGGDLLFTCSLPPQASFYLDREHRRAAEPEDLLQVPRDGRRAWLLIDRKVWARHPEVAAQWPKVSDDGLPDDDLIFCGRAPQSGDQGAGDAVVPPIPGDRR